MATEAALRLLIVDDEPPARARLRRLLAARPDVQVIGEAGDGATALTMVESLAPDALLLDLQMPEVSGLDVAASLPDDGPAVVFVTAFEQYALQAFDAAAVDYLLKPVDPARLARALERLRRQRPAVPAAPTRLLVPQAGRTTVLRVADIEWLQAADNYVELHGQGRQCLLRRTLSGLLGDLGPAFVRIHRARAVALAQVAAVHVMPKGDAEVQMRGGTALRCSRAYRAALVQALDTRP